MSPYLTKSDFKVARDCPAKLAFKKLRYPSRLEADPYLAFLADGGFMVETMARTLYPGGRELGAWDDPEEADRQTRATVSAGDGTWFEATILVPPGLARIDILRRQGSVLDLIEVKSASVLPPDLGGSPFRGKRGALLSAWRPYLEDVTFQAVLLSHAFPDLQVRPFLCVVDKSKTATAHTTFDNFRLLQPQPGQPRWRAEFSYAGDPERLRQDHLLAIVDVSAEVAELRAEVEAAIPVFAASLHDGTATRLPAPIGSHCKRCEYRLPQEPPDRPSGFAACWGPLAQIRPHVLDLFRADLLGGRARDLPAELASRGQASFADIPEDAFQGAVAERQRIQISFTAAGQEWRAPDLAARLATHPYPLHFIDFEGSRIALPYHIGMRPYEQVGFQWSCHTLDAPDAHATTQHAEWLNDTDAFPNFAFARSLMECLGREGTVYTWSPYESTMLRDVRRQMDETGHRDPELAAWLDEFLDGRGGRIVDLCALCRESYFHPDMKGSVSIKAVLPAIWRARAEVRRLSCFQGLEHPQDPYYALPALPVGEDEEVVREGTGAIRAYQDLMFGLAREDPALRAVYRRLLLQYCRLDTAAMVGVWWHWSNPPSQPTTSESSQAQAPTHSRPWFWPFGKRSGSGR